MKSFSDNCVIVFIPVMALVNIATILADTKRILKKTKPPGGIAIIKKEEQLLEIREHGYEEQKFDLPLEKLAKELKTMVKREFPRSRKVRLIKFSDPKELDRIHQKI